MTTKNMYINDYKELASKNIYIKLLPWVVP